MGSSGSGIDAGIMHAASALLPTRLYCRQYEENTHTPFQHQFKAIVLSVCIAIMTSIESDNEKLAYPFQLPIEYTSSERNIAILFFRGDL